MSVLDKLTVRVITLSDRASRGEYEDRSGPVIIDLVKAFCKKHQCDLTVDYNLISDDHVALEALVLKESADVIITTGGTGIGPRDITPDVIKPLLDPEIPGIMEFIRCKHGERLPSALISRSVAGMIGSALVYVLPGSVKAVKEYMFEIEKTLKHSLEMIHGIDSH